MSFEVPTALIRELQISLRKEAGIESYDPEDPSLPDLPSLEQTISELDPSPPYLRCQQCRGPLLRGLQSMVCVYCGALQRRQIPPDPIHFRSTIGYQWLLQSLGVNGSEAVGESDSTKRNTALKKQLVLSDLFDFELKWPSESEKHENKISDRAPHRNKVALNLEGVDLDNFFSESKEETSKNARKKQEIPGRGMTSTDIHAFPVQENINLFEHSQSSDMAVRLPEGAVEEHFSGWETDFQSASSRALPVDSKPIEHFPSSSPTVITGEVGSVLDPEMKFEIDRMGDDAKPKDASGPPSSMGDSWMQDDLWHSSNTKLPVKSEEHQIEDVELNDKSSNISSVKDTWIEDDVWPSGSTKAPESDKIHEDDGGFDAWQDFTSSGNAPDPFSSSLKYTSATPELPSEMNVVNLDNNLQDMDFGSFMPSDLFSGASNLQTSSADVNTVQEAFTPDRVLDATIRGDVKSKACTDENSNRGSESTDNTVETILSQMPDLSFMLESNLSIPKKDDEVNSFS